MGLKKIVVLGTGGTIAGVGAGGSDHTAYLAGQIDVGHLLSGIADLADWGPRLGFEQLAQLDSKDMDHATWQLLARRCAHWLAQPDLGGLVITHGTDTLEETAWFLQSVLAPSKPVVITCAMRPTTALAPDGPQNLLDAITLAADPGTADFAPGAVLTVCAGRIHAADRVSKVHPYRLDAFESGDFGAAGWVEQGRVRWAGPLEPVPAPEPGAVRAMSTPVSQWPWVELLHSHAGADDRQVRALVAAGVRGLLVAGTGNGTVHQALGRALREAQSKAVLVRLSTRCIEGQIVGAGSELPLAQHGLNPYKARISLMLELMS